MFKIDEPLPEPPSKLPEPIAPPAEPIWYYSPTQRTQRFLIDGKKVVMPQYQASSRWITKAGPSPWPFYGKLPEAAGTVIEVEGEKCVDILKALGYAAITHPGHNFKPEANQARYLNIKDRVKLIAYIADNDEPGREKAIKCAANAAAAGVPFIVFHAEHLWPDIKEKGSVDDVDPSLIIPAITEALAKPRPQPSADVQSVDKVRAQLATWLGEGLSGSALQTKVFELATTLGCAPSALQRMVQELQLEDDAGLQADAELAGIRKAGDLEKERAGFKLEELVPAQCVEPLRYLSTSLQVDDLATAMIFLTCASGAVRAGTRIWGDELTFAERPQIWLGLVGKSGLGKSPAMRNLGVTPTSLVKRHYHHRNQQRQELWNTGNPDERGDEPQPFVFQISNYTAGAIVKQFAVNEAERLGVLLACDELAALFSSLNEFQAKGRGSEQEQLLSLFDNNGDAQIRVKEGYRSYEEAQLSIIGGIQPLVFDQLASHGDPAGLFARLLLLPLPTDYRGDNKPANYSKEATHAHQQTLENLVLRILDLPPTGYQLSKDAENHHRAIRRDAHTLADRAVLPAHSNIYGKRAGYVLRIAGAIHILRAAAGEIHSLDTQVVTLSTVQLAEKLVTHLQEYALSAQTRAAMASEGTITELMRTIHRFALDKQVSPGKFRSDALTPAKRKLYSIQTIVSYVQRLVDAGLADWLPSSSRNGSRLFTCKGRLPG